MNFTVTNSDEAKRKMKEDNLLSLPKIHLRFNYNENGFLNLTADLGYEIDLYLKKIEGENGTSYDYVPEFVPQLT